MIYQNYQGLGIYQRYLRQGRKKRKKRGSLQGKRGSIPNRVGIEQRPAIAGEKKELGHWESDTMSLFNSEVHQNLKSIHRILQKEFDSQDIF